MRFFFVLIMGAAAMTAGCSRSEPTPTAKKTPSSPTSGGWASNEKPKAIEATLPKPTGEAAKTPDSDSENPAVAPSMDPADDQNTQPAVDPNMQPATTPDTGPSTIPMPSLEELIKKPESQDNAKPGMPEGATGDQGATSTGEAMLPADAFGPAQAPESSTDIPQVAPRPDSPESEQPSLRNPLRDKERPDDEASNPMRQGPAPLPPSGPTDDAAADDSLPPVSPNTLPGMSPSSLPNETNNHGGKDSGEEPGEEPFDPIKENGPIFVGWPKPKLALVMTGRENGYIEPCGCAGLDRMKGGIGRRHTMVETLKKQGWPVVCLDAGGQIKGYGRQTEIKFQITVEAMRKIGYDAIGFGIKDLQLPAAELVSVAAAPSPFVSANVGLFGFDAQLTAQTKIVEAGGLKIGVTSVLGKSEQNKIKSEEVELVAPEEALTKILPALKKDCNLLVLMVDGTKEESIALAQKFPDFQLVVTTGGPPEPPPEPMRIPNTRSLLIEVGEKGADAVVVGLYDDPKKPLRYQCVPLDSRFKASKDMYRVMVAYQEQLKQLGLEGLGIRPVPHPQSEVNGDFVGSAKCKSCHEESYRVWKKSGHAKAWKTLVENDPPRNFDPECISCHVIGWHPTRHFPYKTGFLSEKKTPEMLNVGCESCHGPCGEHCKAEDGSDLALQEKQYKAIRVTKEEAQTNLSKMCQNCHDLDNSPEFNFETYWPKVEHYEDED